MRIASIDCETDPFFRGQIVAPFAWDIYDGDEHFTFWGDDCTKRMCVFLVEHETKFLLYAHNGGKFDYLFMLPYMNGEQPKIINGRIVKWFFEGHELRDSYSILPVPLKQSGAKKEIDYSKLKRGRREYHKTEIMDYLHSDTETLFNMVLAFKENLGDGLTMAGVATRLLKKLTPAKIQKLSLDQDKEIRQFFFGGRVECFEKGIINDVFNLNDVRSMYPSVMAGVSHPIGNSFRHAADIGDADFIELECYSKGAFPYRTKEGLQFLHGNGTFKVTGHELRTAMSLELVVIHKIVRAIAFTEHTSFPEFVNTYTDLRKQCEQAGDLIGKLHYKLVQNGSYGRLALNPDTLFDWIVTLPDIDANKNITESEQPWEPAFAGSEVIFWRRSVSAAAKQRAISNVATGASITGAARARLLAAISTADRPVYCDTDSIISRRLFQPADDGRLGSWQLEATGDRVAIAAKKLYAMFGEPANDWKEHKARLDKYGHPLCIKLASKGVRLTAPEIERVCNGETIVWQSPSPTMSLTGTQNYMTRTVRMRK